MQYYFFFRENSFSSSTKNSGTSAKPQTINHCSPVKFCVLNKADNGGITITETCNNAQIAVATD